MSTAPQTNPPGGVSSIGRRLGWVFALLVVLLLAPLARADEATPGPMFIGPGHDADVVALLGPHTGGRPVVDGWVVDSIQIPQSSIVFALRGPGGATARAVLVHPDTADKGAARSRHFAILREDPAGAGKAALDVLTATIQKQDQRDLWERPKAFVPIPPKEPEARPQEPEIQGVEWIARAGAIGMNDAIFPRHWIWPFLTDGILLLLAAVVFVLLHLRRVLRDEPAWVWKVLAGLVVVGALLRLNLSVPTVMNAWPFTRVPPVARGAMGGVVLRTLSTMFDVDFYTFDVIHTLDLTIAIISPIVFFAHARFVMKSARHALFAAGLLVILPMHLRFAASDIEYVQSLATSSFTFTLLYIAMRDESALWRGVSFALLPLLSLGTYYVRPENLFFAGIDLAALYLTVGNDVPLRRKLLASAIILGTSTYALIHHVLVQFSEQVDGGLSLETLQLAVTTFFKPAVNTLLNPMVTPPWLPILVVVGAIVLVRSGQPRRALYLSGWLLGFYVVHSAVISHEPMMQARYHMHLITPSLFLGTFGLVAVWDRWPRLRPLVMALLLAAPFLHLKFIRDTNFTVMAEYDFLQSQRNAIPEGCKVLEFIGVAPEGGDWAYTDPMIPRIGERMHHGELGLRWDAIPATYTPKPDEPGYPDLQLTRRAKEALASGQCVVFYEGVVCTTHAPLGRARHPLCEQLAGMSRKVLAEKSIAPRFYDNRSVPISAGIRLPGGMPESLRLAFHQLPPGGGAAPTVEVPPSRGE